MGLGKCFIYSIITELIIFHFTFSLRDLTSLSFLLTSLLFEATAQSHKSHNNIVDFTSLFINIGINTVQQLSLSVSSYHSLKSMLSITVFHDLNAATFYIHPYVQQCHRTFQHLLYKWSQTAGVTILRDNSRIF